MPDWTITVVGLDTVQHRIQTAGPFLRENLSAIMQQRLGEAVQYARQEFLTGGTTETRLAERSGRLKTSFEMTVSSDPQTVTGRLGFLPEADAPSWAWVHLYGAHIIPRHAQFLAIPLTTEAREAGSPRRLPGQTFIQRSRAGNVLVFRKGEDGRIEPEYLLKASVDIPARPSLQPTVEKFIPLILTDIRQAATDALGGAA